MGWLKKKLFIVLTISLLCGLTLPVEAANKSNITAIKANKETQIQLDGTGAKEKVKLTVNHQKNAASSYGNDSYTSTVALTINGKEVFKNTYNTADMYRSYVGKEPVVELVVTDIDTKDKCKDLFLGVYDVKYYGSYQELVRITYKNKKAHTDNVLQTLKAIKSPKLPNEPNYINEPSHRDTSGRGYMLNPIESTEGLIPNSMGNGELAVKGNGTVMWGVCLYTGTAGGDYLHKYITLTLKSGKLKASNYPSGTSSETSSYYYYPSDNTKLLKSMTIYKSAGSSKKAVTVPKGKSVVVIGDFKFVNKKLYVKVGYKKTIGWVPNTALDALPVTGTDHT